MTERTRTFGNHRRRSGGLGGLIALNVVLLGVLGAMTFMPRASAQSRIRGTYTMAAGGVKGALSSALFVVDTTSRELIAVTYDPSTKELTGIGYRDLAVDTANLGRGVPSR